MAESEAVTACWQVRSHRGQQDKKERQVRSEADSSDDQLSAVLYRHRISVHELAARARRTTQTSSPRKRLHHDAPTPASSWGSLVHFRCDGTDAAAGLESQELVSPALGLENLPGNIDYSCTLFTARCTLVQSAVLPSHVVCLSVCLSVCNVGELW